MIEFTVIGRLDGLNEYTRVCRGKCGDFMGNRMKQSNENLIMYFIPKDIKIDPAGLPVRIEYTWYERKAQNGKMRDKDNIAFAQKFVQDALVRAEIIPNDDWKCIDGFIHHFVLSEENKVVIKIFLKGEY